MLSGDVLGHRTRLSAQRTALIEVASGQRFTYEALDRRVTACARVWVGSLGLNAGDRIGILSGNRVAFVDHLCAPGKCGVILVPLNTRLTPPELATIIKDCALKALVYDGDHADTIRALKEHVHLDHWIALDSPLPGDTRYADLISSIGNDRVDLPRPQGEDPYCLLYTSGTTGTPKGVIISHRQVAWNGVNTAICWQLTENDVSSIFTPLYHAGGIGAFLMPLLTVGGTLVLHAGFDAAEIWRTIESEGCTVVLGVPTIWTLLAQADAFDTVDLGQVRWFISGGAPLPRSLIDIYRARGVVLRQGYGLTEVGVNCFSMTDAEAWEKAGSIGKPLMFTEAKLIDDTGHEVAPDTVGELCFRGPHVCLGYWNNPEATAAALDAEGWFHTGDMARKDADGFFFIAGRSKDMFISGGVNVYPAEIENELLRHPDLQDAAVAGVPHPKWGEVGVAFVVAAAGKTAPTADELKAFLAPRLARFKIPTDFIVLNGLPRTEYGKVVKAQLVAQYEQARS